MKTVLSGVALAAILALSMPAWAEGTDAQQSNAPTPSVSPTTGVSPKTGVSTPHAKKANATSGMHTRKTSHKNMKPTAKRHSAGQHYAAHARPMHRTATARLGGQTRSPTDNVANQLNGAEAQRLSGGSTPPMGDPNMAPMGTPNQPRPIQGQ
jgi:hypothetical protein